MPPHAGHARSRADEALALALASGATVPEAALQARVSVRTVFRRLADPAFRGRIQAHRDRMTDAALGKLTSTLTAAADTLKDLLSTEAPAVRLGAAKALLELGGIRLRESLELAERVAELERAPSQGGLSLPDAVGRYTFERLGERGTNGDSVQ